MTKPTTHDRMGYADRLTPESAVSEGVEMEPLNSILLKGRVSRVHVLTPDTTMVFVETWHEKGDKTLVPVAVSHATATDGPDPRPGVWADVVARVRGGNGRINADAEHFTVEPHNETPAIEGYSTVLIEGEATAPVEHRLGGIFHVAQERKGKELDVAVVACGAPMARQVSRFLLDERVRERVRITGYVLNTGTSLVVGLTHLALLPTRGRLVA